MKPHRLLLCLLLIFASLLLHSQATTEKKRGRCVVHEPDGSVSVGHSKNHLRKGKWYTSYPNHTIKSFGKYECGHAVGRHEGFWPNGKRQWIADYSAGKRHGIFMTFDSNGDTVESSNYREGVLWGYYYKKDTVTQFWERGEYMAGAKQGTWTTAVHDSVITCGYVGNVKHGSCAIYTPGKHVTEGFYANGIRDSVWREYKCGVLYKEYWYKNGKQYKTDKTFFHDGKSVYCEVQYRAPDDASKFTIYREHGVPGKIEWYSNFITDSIHLYHPNGKLQSRSIYKKCYDGKPVVHVANYVYDENGKLLIKTLSGPNGKDSLRYDYNTNGKVIRAVNFTRGSIYATTYYYDNGKLRVRYAQDSIQVYSEDGKKLKLGTPAYSKVFAQIDSIENALPVIPVYNVPDAPAPPYTLAGVNGMNLIPPVLPSFPGGKDSLRAYLSRNMKYSQYDLETMTQGKVTVGFIVEADGSLTDIKIIQALSDSHRPYRQEALRLVKAMPKWKPGEDANGPTRVVWSIPIVFSPN